MTRGQCGWLTLHCQGLAPFNTLPAFPGADPNFVFDDTLSYSTALYYTITACVCIASPGADRTAHCHIAHLLDRIIQLYAVLVALRACKTAPCRPACSRRDKDGSKSYSTSYRHLLLLPAAERGVGLRAG